MRVAVLSLAYLICVRLHNHYHLYTRHAVSVYSIMTLLFYDLTLYIIDSDTMNATSQLISWCIGSIVNKQNMARLIWQINHGMFCSTQLLIWLCLVTYPRSNYLNWFIRSIMPSCLWSDMTILKLAFLSEVHAPLLGCFFMVSFLLFLMLESGHLYLLVTQYF